MLLKLFKTFFNLFILRKKEIGFAITNKKNININSKIIKDIVINLMVMIAIITTYVLLAYFFNLYYQLLPLTTTIIYFPFSFFILDIISMLKTKVNYDAQETVEGISLF
jgi:ABC-type transport system involved in Fe-S cluster assembly fused permease/ATPase subunit